MTPNDDDPRKWFLTRLEQCLRVTAIAIVSTIATGALLQATSWYLTAAPLAGFVWARFFPEHFSFIRRLRSYPERAVISGAPVIAGQPCSS